MGNIRSIEISDCAEVARLHITYLQTPFTGRAGFELLKTYYTALLLSGGASGFVAVQDAKVLGYICGVFDPGQVKNYLLRHHAFRLAAFGALAVLSKPGMILDFVSRLLRKSVFIEPVQGYELRPIVVTQAGRGQGIAKLLLDALVHDAAGRGFDRIYCLTEIENAAANRFYQKNAFQQTGQLSRSGQSYVCYERRMARPV